MEPLTYIAAFNAEQLFPVNSPSFLSAFWRLYTKASERLLATDPCMGDLINYETVNGDEDDFLPTNSNNRTTSGMKSKLNLHPESRMPVSFVDYIDEHHSPVNLIDKSLISFQENPPTDIYRTMVSLTKYLLNNQKEVFVTVLGLTGEGRLNYTEAAAKLGRGKDEVSKIFGNCCKRLKRFVTEGKIKTDSFPRLMLVSITGRKRPSLVTASPVTNSVNQSKKQSCYAEENELRLAA